MSLVHSLGVLLIVQKFLTIPNFSEKSRVKSSTVVLRMTPIFLIILSSSADPLILAIFSSKEVTVGHLVGMLEIFIHRVSIILIFIIGIKNNRKHLTVILTVVSFEQKIMEECQIEKNFSKKCCCSLPNLEFFFIVIFNFGLSIIFFAAYSENFTFYEILTQYLHIILTASNDLFILYLGHILGELKRLLSVVKRTSKLKEINDFLITTNFLKLFNLVNEALGSLMLVTYFQHIISCSLGAYYIFWIGSTTKISGINIYFLFGSIIWTSRDAIYMIFLSNMGNSLKYQMDEYLSFQNRVENVLASNEYRKKDGYKNQSNHKLWIHHLERGIVACGSLKINNSGIFSIITFVTTVIVVLIQFKNIEDNTT
uniref:Gustatory receptor n=1 Tax=Phlebotomus papatasi TaxID=29031 RepID=A0A3F2ZEL5_PHLPP